MSKEQYPAIAVVLQDIGDAILKGKTTNGDPIALAEAHSATLGIYLQGVQLSGRPIMAIDSHALDALDAITAIAMAPRREAFYALAAAGILGAAHMLMVEEAIKRREEAPQAPQEPAEAEGYDPDGHEAEKWDERGPDPALFGVVDPYGAHPHPQTMRDATDDLFDKAHATPVERESFRADMGRPERMTYLPSFLMEEGDEYPTNQSPGTLVRISRGRDCPVLIGYIGVQGQMIEMRHCIDKPNYTETVHKLAATERELAETFAKLKAS